MNLTGCSFIAGKQTVPHGKTFHAVNPRAAKPIAPEFFTATEADVDTAMRAADEAFQTYQSVPGATRAAFMEKIAEEIMALGDALLLRAAEETGLGLDRLTGERARTCGQLKLYAATAREGSWVDARIDRALPERQPLPRPDLRRMLVPIGPVVVFGSSNFPLAYSIAGGDTASALAAGCPVVVKAHEAHPGTSELVAQAINRAVAACGMPPGVFSLLQGDGRVIGGPLVQHPLTRAVGFTGSLRAGRALADVAAARPEPIPVFAEMGSLNPVFLLPGALQERAEKIAEGFVASFTLGVGQFCTKPGLVFAVAAPELDVFLAATSARVKKIMPGTMLHQGIGKTFATGSSAMEKIPDVHVLARAEASARAQQTEGAVVLMLVEAQTFLAEPKLAQEVFGPFALVVRAKSAAELEALARQLDGQLTATLHATDADAELATRLLPLLTRKAGRVLFNGFPTGVEVSPAMQHGGPYPASTDSRFTAVGTAALLRWARPVCFQNTPVSFQPEALRDENPLGMLRTVEGIMARH
jgi:alpha-ketoglutaric semialdehyde dehydrogenase